MNYFRKLVTFGSSHHETRAKIYSETRPLLGIGKRCIFHSSEAHLRWEANYMEVKTLKLDRYVTANVAT